MTEQELLSNVQAPCVTVDMGDVDAALAAARRFDQQVCLHTQVHHVCPCFVSHTSALPRLFTSWCTCMCMMKAHTKPLPSPSQRVKQMEMIAARMMMRNRVEHMHGY